MLTVALLEFCISIDAGLEWIPEAVDAIVGGRWGVEADVDPAVGYVNAFRFEANGVEVEGVDFAAGSEMDDVKPVVAWAVAIGEIGIAVFDFTALGYFDTVDGYGLQDIVVGKDNFFGMDSGQTEFFE